MMKPATIDKVESNPNPPLFMRGDDSLFTPPSKLRIALGHARAHHRAYQWCIAAMTLVGVHRVTGADVAFGPDQLPALLRGELLAPDEPKGKKWKKAKTKDAKP